MKRRKLLIALATAAVFAVTVPAAPAELRRLSVTLLNGEKLTVTVDVPPGTPADQVSIPGLPAPVLEVVDLGPVEVPPTTTPTPPSVPEVPTPEGSPAVPGPAATPEPPKAGDQPSQAPDGSGGQRDDRGSGAGGGAAPTRRGRAPSARDRFADLQANAESLAGQVDREVRKQVDQKNPTRNVDGSPTLDNPTFSLATPGAAQIGVPNFFIEKFRIPPFLLPVYQAAGIQYGVRWEVLAAINEIETDYGRNLNVSSAGARGWMQFMPGTWKMYGVDANKDGEKDPYNPVDSIFAAARYLRAAGAEQDLRKAVFAYNHAAWYVDSVLLRARLIGGLPSNLVGSLTGLTQGRFPVHARATYAKEVTKRDLKRGPKGRSPNPAYVVEASGRRRGIKIFARRGAPVVAVNDAKVLRVGRTERLGRFVQIQDVYGNTYTYGRLKKVAKSYPAPKRRSVSRAEVRRELKLDEPRRDRKPTAAASATTKASLKARRNAAKVSRLAAATRRRDAARRNVAAGRRQRAAKQRLFANPGRPRSNRAGGDQQIFQRTGRIEGATTFKSYFSTVFGLDRKGVVLKKLRPGARIAAGTILGRIGTTSSTEAPHVLFEIRPAGRGAPRIDPKPVLDGWKLLESTAIYRAAGKNPFFGPDAKNPSIGQILLMSKEALIARVLTNPRVEIYGCGRQDIQTHQVDRRVLATLEFLAASGFKPTVSSLKCGHGYYTKSGNVSHHSSGNAVDIAAINGVPILGNQGKGSITELAVQRLLTLQGTMEPDQIITLMTFEGAANTFAMSDHADHIHVGWRPLYGTNSKTAKQVNAVLKPKQWIKLIDRLGEIDNPTVRLQPSKYSVKVVKRASDAHRGE